MHLIAGLSLPMEMRLFLHGFQNFFPSRDWKPLPLLYLPLVAFGRMPPQVWEELDQTLYTLHLPAPVTLRHTGFDVSLKQNRIMLEATVEASVIDHLSVKIRNQARLAGVPSTRSLIPSGIALADITDVDPDVCSLWLATHRHLFAQIEEVYEFTVFKTGKNRENPFWEVMAEYQFAEGFSSSVSLL
ncbi:hypothetical protein [Acetobacter sp.]|jgi:hypothetical protein|uniref:hypothetical protein n=1 Tax=Acetobacter sp. TaxID=440 RepID=UPI0039ED8B25